MVGDSTGPVSIEAIRAAQQRLTGLIKVTPLDLSATLTERCGRAIYLKLENLQKTGSFKVRGALNKIQRLDPSSRTNGVVAASAGNHAQGVAYAARCLGIRATVVMPETASFSKVNATAGYGAEVVLSGRDYGQAYARALDLARSTGATLIHAFDDADVIAGQATVGIELFQQLPDVDAVVVPVGGGGLLAGIMSVARSMAPAARILAVQPLGASALAPSLRAGERIQLKTPDTIADGLATGSLGALPFDIIRQGNVGTVEVSDTHIAGAILFLLERTKTVAEGAGAAGVAACLGGHLPQDARKVAVVISGGNIDISLLDRIINLGLVAEGRLFRFRTRLRDRPGELLRLVTSVSEQGANIHQIRHHRAEPGLAPTHAAVTLELETRGREHANRIAAVIAAAGFELDVEPESSE
jgi:threonine dehydratase